MFNVMKLQVGAHVAVLLLQPYKHLRLCHKLLLCSSSCVDKLQTQMKCRHIACTAKPVCLAQSHMCVLTPVLGCLCELKEHVPAP